MTRRNLRDQPIDDRSPGPGADVSWHFADVAARIQIEDLSPAAVEAAKHSILDGLGVCLAASGLEPAVRPVVDTVHEFGGRPEATVLGFGHRAPAAMAAFANGALAHALDYDDLTPWGQHAGSSVIPAALAIAERQGGASGRDLIAAVAAGQDMFARMRCNIGWRKDWNLGSVLGVYAATAATGRILGMTTEVIHNALGIATQQSCGVMEVVAGLGSDFRGMYAGFSAKGAVLAVLLAERGMSCVESPFEGQYGIFTTYFGGEFNRDGMIDKLGRDFQGAATLYKRWPVVGTSHSHLHATLGIMDTHGLVADDVDEIRVYVGDYHQLMCAPLNRRRSPQTLMDARFSLPFILATAIVHSRLSVQDLTAESLQDPRVLEVARRVVPIADSAYDWKLDLPPGRVAIVTRDGRSFEEVGTEVPGSPDTPLTWGQLVSKFEECAPAAANPPSEEGIRSAVEMIRDLESLEDATQILRVLH